MSARILLFRGVDAAPVTGGCPDCAGLTALLPLTRRIRAAAAIDPDVLWSIHTFVDQVLSGGLDDGGRHAS